MKIILTLEELRELMDRANVQIYVEESLPDADTTPTPSTRKRKAAARTKKSAKKQAVQVRRHKGRCRKDGTCCMTPVERRAYRKAKIVEKYKAASMVDPQRDAEYMQKVHA